MPSSLPQSDIGRENYDSNTEASSQSADQHSNLGLECQPTLYSLVWNSKSQIQHSKFEAFFFFFGYLLNPILELSHTQVSQQLIRDN
jgi:hypothetical protein